MTTNPELSLIQKLSETRQALEAERESLLARVAGIDEALGAPTPKSQQKPAKGPKDIRTPRQGGIKEAVIAAVTRSPALTIREIQESLAEHPAKSVENMVRSLAAAGKLRKDESSPRKFSVPVTTPTNGKANGAHRSNGVPASA